MQNGESSFLYLQRLASLQLGDEYSSPKIMQMCDFALLIVICFDHTVHKTQN